MAKRKRKTKKRRLAAWLTAIALACVGLLFMQETESAAADYGDKPEIPQLQNGRPEQIIHHEGYTVSYNADFKTANWVAYELTSHEADSREAGRRDRFMPDPMVAPEESATNDDYSQSGFDRGHLAPAGDMKWSHTAMSESFYLTNICPQDRGLNTGIWNSLEMQCRKWAAQYGRLLIVTGPVTDDSARRIGPHRVGVPKAFYKVVCIPSGDKPRGIGFLFENRSYTKTSFRSMAISIDSVERVTGIDFFPTFPLKEQEEMESSTELSF
jgi:endonuclease G